MVWIRSVFNRYMDAVKENKKTSNLYKAQKHALLALAYWKACEEEADLHFQIKNSNIYVKLGK